MGDPQIIKINGPGLSPYLEALARLRITVFAEYPYLYEGTLEYERDYLKCYLESERSLVALVLDGEDVVGATTCVPLSDEGPEFQAPFLEHRYDPAKVCYFGESVLLTPYRGQGLGRTFFQIREEHARTLGAEITAFCAVDRPENHPRRPASYLPLDGLWIKQGYIKHPELQARFSWKEFDAPEESLKTLTFWLKRWI